MSPKLAAVEVAVGKDSDEHEGVEARRSVGARHSGHVTTRISGHAAGSELPPRETIAATISAGGRERAGASRCRPAIESGDLGDDSRAGARVGPDEIRWGSGRSIRTDLGDRASGE